MDGRQGIRGLPGGRVSTGCIWSVALTALLASPVQAQLDLGSSQRGDDGTVYEVVRVPSGSLVAGSEEIRVTQIAGSVSGVQSCSTVGGTTGQSTSAAVGADPNAGQMLHPLADTRRTAVFVPNDTTVNFVPSNGGRLMLGNGGGQVEVCRVSTDCTGGATDVPIVTLDNNVDSVGRACVAPATAPGCALGGQRSMLGFGSALDPGADGACDTNPTTDTTICADRPGDGFTMSGGEVIVFIYNGSLAAGSFAVGAAGFGIDTDGVNGPPCPADPTNGSVVAAVAQIQSLPPPPMATATPTNTSSGTPTNTPLASPTPTATESVPFGCCVCQNCGLPPSPTCLDLVTVDTCNVFCLQPVFMCESFRFSTASSCASSCVPPPPTPTPTVTPTSTATATNVPTPTPSNTPETGCPATPDPACSTPAKALLKIKDEDADGAGPNDGLLFKFIKGPAQAQGDFGDPTSSATYSLCIYEGASAAMVIEVNVASGGTCDGDDCWKEIENKGFKFKDSAAAQDGISKILLKADAATPKTTVLVKGKDGALPLNPDTLPLDTAGVIKAQVHNSDNSTCWGADFPSPIRNGEVVFKGKIP